MRLDPEEQVLTTVRERAYNRAVEQLKDRTTLAETLTDEQLESFKDLPCDIGAKNETKT
jgi:hypothetical protein